MGLLCITGNAEWTGHPEYPDRLPVIFYINVLYPVSHDVPYNQGIPLTFF